MNSASLHLPGALVTLPLPRGRGALDGFWAPGRRASDTLVIFVHGMGSNFYRSAFKKATLIACVEAGLDILLFNNRGAEKDVATERFRDCLADLDAAAAFARRHGYRRLFLIGHSTGCQKITYWMTRRNDRRVGGLILAAIGDDLAIAQRDLGRQYPAMIRRAKARVRRGRGDTRMPEKCLGFAAHRFLSAADPASLEAGIFSFAGDLRVFRRVTCPVLALFPENEQYACIPVREMAHILAARTRSRAFAADIIPDADHSFHGREREAAAALVRWIASVQRSRIRT